MFSYHLEIGCYGAPTSLVHLQLDMPCWTVCLLIVDGCRSPQYVHSFSLRKLRIAPSGCEGVLCSGIEKAPPALKQPIDLSCGRYLFYFDSVRHTWLSIGNLPRCVPPVRHEHSNTVGQALWETHVSGRQSSYGTGDQAGLASWAGLLVRRVRREPSAFMT